MKQKQIMSMAFDNLIGLLGLFAASVLYSNCMVATAQAHNKRDFAETLQVSWSLLTAISAYCSASVVKVPNPIGLFMLSECSQSKVEAQ